MADMDNEQMVNIILEFVYNLVCSGDLAMAKVLRVIILDKYRAKQLVVSTYYINIHVQMCIFILPYQIYLTFLYKHIFLDSTAAIFSSWPSMDSYSFSSS